MPKKVSKKTTKTVKKTAALPKMAAVVYPSSFGQETNFILWVNLATRQATPIWGKLATKYATIYQREKLHEEALQQAMQNGIYHYEWSSKVAGKTVYFQTSCITFVEPDGKVGSVLCCSRDISHLGSLYFAETNLQECSAPKTFPQILLAAREFERKTISKALHDEVGSSSVILTALLSLVKMNIKKGNVKGALRDVEQLDFQIKQVIARLRDIIVSLRPPTLDNPGGLCGAIEDLLKHISSLSHIPYQFNCQTKDFELSENVRILLFRVVQEALTNIVKHARAKHMVVCLKRTGSSVRLQIRDDGIGFDPNASVSLEHVGLLAMKESVELLGGTLTIRSTLGKGTRIEVVCPSVVYRG